MRGGPQPYTQLRQELAKRDRSLREKVVSLEEAASFVRDGDAVGIGGSTMSRTPMAMIWALIRAQRKNLSCSRCIISSDGDLLFGSGVCDHIISSWFSQGILWGVSKVMRHHTETRQGAFRGMEPHGGGHALPRRRHGRALHADPLDARLRRAEAAARGQGDRMPLHGREDPAGAGAQPRRGADPRPALRRLWQCADRRAAVHGHRPRHGGEQGDPDDRAHRLQRPDPARAGPDQDPVLRGGCRGRGAVRLRAARMLRRSTSR